ncbi:MAG: ABC transporter substrate-binding protein, partial [Actinomycetota bacterium]|nr:ABC transporter substrate-binding protein [Actinomycetota bacterium]
LAEHLVPKQLSVALLTDDTGYGRAGAKALEKAFRGSESSVAERLTLPSSSSDLAPQVLRARRAGATALLVWAQAPTIAKVLIAARGSGWDVPVYTPSAGEDPLVRQQLADHPEWIDGLTFAAGRMTAEVGTGPWTAFQDNYESAYGPEEVGVRTRAGEKVVQPPDYAMYSYDFVNVLAAALVRAKVTRGDALLAALESVTIQGANGDERGFNERNHEGVIDDDVYFARFDDMVFEPVGDDPLSSTLPAIEQRR